MKDGQFYAADLKVRVVDSLITFTVDKTKFVYTYNDGFIYRKIGGLLDSDRLESHRFLYSDSSMVIDDRVYMKSPIRKFTKIEVPTIEISKPTVYTVKKGDTQTGLAKKGIFTKKSLIIGDTIQIR